MRDRPAFDLFLISWLILFLELTCIRWFPSHVMFLTFFTNIVLLASFVGMSVGCLTANSPTRHLIRTPVWLAVAVVLGFVFDNYRYDLMRYVAVGDQSKPDVIYFGTEATQFFEVPFRVPVEVIAGAFFLLIATIHVGPGQEMGRAFDRIPVRTRAYMLNLLGSLAGILMFSVCSYLQLPPLIWFIATAIGIAYFLLRPEPAATPAAPPMAVDTPAGLAGTPGGSPPPAPGGHGGRLALLGLVILVSVPTSGLFLWKHREMFWSPYYRVDYAPNEYEIYTNLVSHQLMESRNQPSEEPYALPYLFQRDVPQFDKQGNPIPGTQAWPKFKRILIIGAGSGNDLARALQWAGNDPDVWIDAVEIDPVIQRIGTLHHPDNPYADSRVHLELNDGRNFLSKAPSGTYDLVVFALIDSLVLHSGYSNLRLESYLFTKESFESVKRVLKPTGVCTVYNFFRQGWLASRLNKELREVFGANPVVLTIPTLRSSDPLGPNTDQKTKEEQRQARNQIIPQIHTRGSDGGQGATPLEKIELEQFGTAFTSFYAGSPEVIDPLRKAFVASKNAYWYPWYVAVAPNGPGAKPGFADRFNEKGEPLPPSAFPEPPGDEVVKDRAGRPIYKLSRQGFLATPDPMWMRLKVAEVADDPNMRVATDDWPFLYVRTPTIPGVTLRGMAMMVGLSVLLWWLFRPPTGRGLSAADTEWGLIGRSFFLGAGFMLVETKAVVHMALLFGGTWLVNSAVFAAILMMSLAGTLFVAGVKPKRLEPYYLGLFAALGLGLAIPLSAFLGMDRTTQIVLACALVFAPIAFAGVVFATSLGRSRRPAAVMGANVAGALLGGLSENASVLLGFQYLLCVAVGFYLLSAACANRILPAGEANKSV